MSSISGSDSESDDQSEQDSTAYAVNQGKIFFQNAAGKVFSMYRSVLHEKKVCRHMAKFLDSHPVISI